MTPGAPSAAQHHSTGKKSRLKKYRREASPGDAVLTWPSEEGIQALVPGEPPSASELAALSAAYQQRIRESPLWEAMIKEFGEQKAAELLKECKAKLR